MSGVLLTILAIFFFSQSSASKIRYDNYRVYSVKIENADHSNQLKSLENEYDFWKNGQINQHSDIMVPPHKIEEFENYIANINSSIKINNVQSLIDLESNETGPQQIEFGWTSYHTYDEIYAWLDTLLLQYPTILTNHLVGTSYEGRPIRAIQLSKNVSNPVIFVEANMHAREWITSATATWILNELLTSDDPSTQALSNNYNWVIVPIVNVDGFAYTQTNRMWRKTRQPHSLFCVGADPNRNFDSNWLYNNQGASKNPCSTSFAGPYAFSEPETKAFADFYKTISDSVKLYLAFHSYGQYILLPYGHTFILPANYHDMMSIGLKGVTALRNAGTEYIIGTVNDVMYVATGDSIGWAYDVGRAPLVLEFELRDIRNGNYGFLLPADQIIPNCLEVMDAIKAMIAEAVVLNYL